MPRADELPDSLVELVRRHALELSPARFEFDTSRLLKVLDLTLAEVRTTQGDPALELAPAEKVPDPSPRVVQETPAPPEQEQQRVPPAALPHRAGLGRHRRGCTAGQAAPTPLHTGVDPGGGRCRRGVDPAGRGHRCQLADDAFTECDPHRWARCDRGRRRYRC
jgi:hypothetical protein